jgi:peroxisomal 2,4-dienoyl-CoA reductase
MGVRSNVIAPGPTGKILIIFSHTRLLGCIHLGGTEGFSRLTNQTRSENDSSTYPLGRVSHVKDVANATVFLFSDAAANITGQILPVDGGNGHMASFQLPYPQSILNPDSVKHMINSRL